jgi:hypothetical protein
VAISIQRATDGSFTHQTCFQRAADGPSHLFKNASSRSFPTQTLRPSDYLNPKERQTGRLALSKLRPSGCHHLHPNIVSQRSSPPASRCRLPMTNSFHIASQPAATCLPTSYPISHRLQRAATGRFIHSTSHPSYPCYLHTNVLATTIFPGEKFYASSKLR